jgi:hypothetical protein
MVTPMATKTLCLRLNAKCRNMKSVKTTIAVALVILASSSGLSVPAEDANGPVLKGKAAFGGWQQDRPGAGDNFPPLTREVPS